MKQSSEEYMPKAAKDIEIGHLSVKTWRQLVSDCLTVDKKAFDSKNMENYRYALSKLLKTGDVLAIPINEMVMANFCFTCLNVLNNSKF